MWNIKALEVGASQGQKQHNGKNWSSLQYWKSSYQCWPADALTALHILGGKGKGNVIHQLKMKNVILYWVTRVPTVRWGFNNRVLMDACPLNNNIISSIKSGQVNSIRRAASTWPVILRLRVMSSFLHGPEAAVDDIYNFASLIFKNKCGILMQISGTYAEGSSWKEEHPNKNLKVAYLPSGE